MRLRDDGPVHILLCMRDDRLQKFLSLLSTCIDLIEGKEFHPDTVVYFSAECEAVGVYLMVSAQVHLYPELELLSLCAIAKGDVRRIPIRGERPGTDEPDIGLASGSRLT